MTIIYRGSIPQRKTNQNAFKTRSTNKKYAQNETEYEEYSVTHEVPSYLNIFDCGKNILNILDVTYKHAYVATTEEKYYPKILESLVD